MTPTDQPWYRFVMGESGEPSLRSTGRASRVQRQVVRELWRYANSEWVDDIVAEVNGALSGIAKEGGYGISTGGDFGFHFELDGRVIVWFEYDHEAEGDDRYPAPARELTMPMSEFEPLFREWAASVRHWEALKAKHGGVVPKEHWPKSYPPKLSS